LHSACKTLDAGSIPAAASKHQPRSAGISSPSDAKP
jgi:hypothetical protein